MKRKLHILNIEDNRDDSELIGITLAREGIECDLVRVETREAFLKAIEHNGFHLILADYSLPTFDGLSALEIAKEKCPGVPFIFVSGAIGEEFAIETLKRGATDYVLKDRLSRLALAIRRALNEFEEQTKRRQAEQEVGKYQRHLEELVRDRTKELNRANELLNIELAERRSAENALHRREQEFKALAENVPDVVQRFDKKLRHLYINPAVERITGMPPGAFMEKAYRELGFPDNLTSSWEEALQKVFATGQEDTVEFEMLSPGGKRFLEARLVPEFAENGSIESVLAISRDVTERKNLEEQLHTASITDELTSLHNRRGFLLLAGKQLEIARRNRKPFSILYLDLDEMKKINDEFGHKEGDQALVDISNLLRKTFRESDIIARIGGDEFTVLITAPTDATVEKTVAQHINDNLRVYNAQAEKRYELSVSMGMVHYDPELPCSVEELLDRADALMYAHKQHRQYERERPLSKTEGKRRGSDRHEIDGNRPAELVVWGSHMIKDMSMSGISVRTTQRLTKNTVYTVKMHFNSKEELSLKGLVVWSSLTGRVSGKESDTHYYEAGLKFIDLDDRLMASLEKVIRGIDR